MGGVRAPQRTAQGRSPQASEQCHRGPPHPATATELPLQRRVQAAFGSNLLLTCSLEPHFPHL